MTITPRTHLVTSDEIDRIKAIPFVVGDQPDPEEDFINAKFANFEAFDLLDSLNKLLMPCFGLNGEKRLLGLKAVPTLSIALYTNNHADENEGFAVYRHFYYEGNDLVVKHEFLRLPLAFRRKGIATNLTKLFLQQYFNMGVKRIKVVAALKDGGLVWAKSFFTADNKSEMAKILEDAEKELTAGSQNALIVKRIYENYYQKNPVGKAFPIQKWAVLPFMDKILSRNPWQGTVDLTNPEQSANFINHVYGTI